LVDEFFPFCYLAAVGFVAEFCEGDLSLLDGHETEVFRCIDYRQQLVEVDAEIDGKGGNVRFSIVRLQEIK